MPSTGVASAEPVQRSDRPVEDCRDYLRTGRCKYGASCKYNHPPNVQSGGGMTTPIDPSEPLFPIRPNEPLCQYYMKHGTCKFGQACKFNHPPQSVVAAAAATSPSPITRRPDAPRMILNPVGTDGSSMMLQFLPQRPDEPDCIYFLKNGRCKYGATCRYHHPINGSFQHRRQEERRVAGRTDPQFGNKIQFLSQGGQITQGIVTDSPVAFVSIDGSQTLAPVTFVPTNDQYCAPPGNTVATENASSVSSIGSSHDTSGASLEYVSVPSDGSNALWQRARRNGSGGSLNAYVDPGRLSRNRLTPSSSDGNIARRGRTGSHGSASDHGTAYFESSQSADTAWRQNRSGSFDQTRRPQEPRSPSSLRGRPPPARGPSGPRMVQQRPRQGEGDEGYAMMTSALLNMLETPEETSAELYSEDGTYHYTIDDDDASRLIEGLSLQSQAATAVISNPNVQYEESHWSPSWKRSEDPPQGQEIIHPTYMQSNPPPQTGHTQYHPHQTFPSSEHSSDFGQYLP